MVRIGKHGGQTGLLSFGQIFFTGFQHFAEGLSGCLCKSPGQTVSWLSWCCLNQVRFYPVWEVQYQVLEGLVPTAGASAFYQPAATGRPDLPAFAFGLLGLLLGPL